MSNENAKKEAELKIEKMKDYIKEKILDGTIKCNIKHRTNMKYMLEHYSENDYMFKSLIQKILLAMMPMGIDYMNEHYFTKGVESPLMECAECFSCGNVINLYMENGVIFDKDEIECYDAKPFSFELKVTSGELIFCDWIRTKSKVLKVNDGENINSDYGTYKTSINYAEHNIGHVFVGNTCPNIVQDGNTIMIGRDGYIEETDEEVKLTTLGGESRGYICTDLWWGTFFEEDTILKIIKEKYSNKVEEVTKEFYEGLKDSFITRIKLKKGIYKITHYYGLVEYEDRKPEIFTKIEKIREL